MIAPGSFTPELVALAAIGFGPEMTGGGIFAASRYFPNGAHVLITGWEGSGLPEAGDWLVGIYPPNWEGEEIAYFASDADDGPDLNAAALLASAAAERLGA